MGDEPEAMNQLMAATLDAAIEEIVVVAGKHALPQWLNMDAAVVHCTEGIGIWRPGLAGNPQLEMAHTEQDGAQCGAHEG